MQGEMSNSKPRWISTVLLVNAVNYLEEVNGS